MAVIHIHIPDEERRAFDLRCRQQDPPTNMTWRLRELMVADIEGWIDLPRTPPPPKSQPAGEKVRPIDALRKARAAKKKG